MYVVVNLIWQFIHQFTKLTSPSIFHAMRYHSPTLVLSTEPPSCLYSSDLLASKWPPLHANIKRLTYRCTDGPMLLNKSRAFFHCSSLCRRVGCLVQSVPAIRTWFTSTPSSMTSTSAWPWGWSAGRQRSRPGLTCASSWSSLCVKTNWRPISSGTG